MFPEARVLLGPCSLPGTPHLDKNQSFEDTEHCQQHNHKLLVSHILISSNLAARQKGDLATLFFDPASLVQATVSASYHVVPEKCPLMFSLVPHSHTCRGESAALTVPYSRA